MSTSDNHIASLEAQNTSSRLFAATALSVYMFTQPIHQSVAPPSSVTAKIRFEMTSGSANQSGHNALHQIAREFMQVYKTLLANQVEMDSEISDLIHANLWDLYA